MTIILDEEDYGDKVESYASCKRLKGKFKKVPVCLPSGVNNDKTIQKGLRKIIKRNVNVTDFDQVFYVLITCVFSSWSIFYTLFYCLLIKSLYSKNSLNIFNLNLKLVNLENC